MLDKPTHAGPKVQLRVVCAQNQCCSEVTQCNIGECCQTHPHAFDFEPLVIVYAETSYCCQTFPAPTFSYMTAACGAMIHSLRTPGLSHQPQDVWFGHRLPCRPSPARFLAQHLLIAPPEEHLQEKNQLWLRMPSFLQNDHAGVPG